MDIRCYNPKLTVEDRISLVEGLTESSLRIHFGIIADKYAFMNKIQDDGFELSGLSGDRSPDGEWADIFVADIESYNRLSEYLNDNFDVIVIPSIEYQLEWEIEGEIVHTETHISGKAITEQTAPERQGYYFKWTNLIKWMEMMNYTIKGEYLPNKHKITYIVDGREYRTQDINFNETVVPIADPVKIGYSFSGWSELPKIMPDEDLTASGTFTANEYTLTYLVDNVVFTTQTYHCGESIVTPSQPTREGYTFVGWNKLPNTMPADDLTVTALWEEITNE